MGNIFPQYPHFPSVEAKSVQNNQHSYQSLPLLLQALHVPVNTSVLKAGSAHRQASRAAAELREPDPSGAALLHWRDQTNHSTTPKIQDKLKSNSRQHQE